MASRPGSVVLAPSERAVVDVLFETAGDLALEHRTPGRTYRLAGITVGGEPVEPSLRGRFEVLRLRVGDRVKIRLVSEMDSDHPMHHPFHVHGAGLLSRDGVVEPNLVWSDTVLVRTGETVDILLDVTNPGIWMAHTATSPSTTRAA